MAAQTGSQAVEQKNWRRLAVQTFIVGLLSLSVGLWTLDHPGSLPGRLVLAAALVTSAIVMLSPTMIAIRAMRRTRRMIRAQANEPLRVTQLVNDALYGSRGLLYVVVGTMPLMVFATFYLIIGTNTILINVMGCKGNYEQESFGCYLFPTPSNGDLVNSFLALTALAVAFWGLALLGASLGVGLGLRARYITVLAVIVVVLLLLASVGVAALLLQAPPVAPLVKATWNPNQPGKLIYVQGQTPAEKIPAIAPGLLPQSILIMLLPYALSAGIMRRSRRNLPKGTTGYVQAQE